MGSEMCIRDRTDRHTHTHTHLRGRVVACVKRNSERALVPILGHVQDGEIALVGKLAGLAALARRPLAPVGQKGCDHTLDLHCVLAAVDDARTELKHVVHLDTGGAVYGSAIRADRAIRNACDVDSTKVRVEGLT